MKVDSFAVGWDKSQHMTSSFSSTAQERKNNPMLGYASLTQPTRCRIIEARVCETFRSQLTTVTVATGVTVFIGVVATVGDAVVDA